MEEKKQKSINEILPVELIQRILLRIPVKHLGRLKCVSKLWYSLISDPDFAESHLHLSLAPTHGYLFKKDSTEAFLVHLEEVFNGDNYEVKEVSFPFKKQPPSEFRIRGSCRGFVLLSREPHFFVVWNPLTGFSKRISYSCMVPRNMGRYFHFLDHAILYGFGYDASRDDYLVVVAWQHGGCQRLDCLSLRANSWISLDAALPKPLGLTEWRSRGLFLNGSIHWFASSHVKHYYEALLVFDLKERSFLKISLPEQPIMRGPTTFVILDEALQDLESFQQQGKESQRYPPLVKLLLEHEVILTKPKLQHMGDERVQSALLLDFVCVSLFTLSASMLIQWE
ncbi:F-box protein CPR30-like isoform X1 [Arachis ipaensis]|uniref:F-box protein CPR1-like n=2 Tax=Arachis TaxID=3817 RepID=UPI0007AF8988|nr:F-box protein CPR30-like isoform X1 [Arachis ipaensis]XP_025650235.1 F-box protein CPR1-like [Arachis hypogaea]XP_025696964.1 F-box protein CPR1-like isoform X1 [Arachis hypogaea]